MPVQYGDMIFQEGFRVDLLLDEALIIEIKSTDQIAPVHQRQLLTYLRMMRLPLGLLMNFGAPTLRDGLKRVVNDHKEEQAWPLKTPIGRA